MKLFLNENERQIKKLRKTADKVIALEEKYSAMSNDELKAMTSEFKQKLADGEKLDNLLPDAFAVVREASTRVLNMRHYPVQIIGGIVLHQGRIAEMGTGEGKTLVATLPAYLNALDGKGVHIVTVNDYLAKRDALWMGKVYEFLGLTVGIIVPQMPPQEKILAYKADITYCTNNELGFDFLRDNMVTSKESCVLRDLHFAIIDEVDSILIDEARTPLIISGRGDKSSELYKKANAFAKTLHEGEDFEIAEKEKTIVLTESESTEDGKETIGGLQKAEKYFNIKNMTDMDNSVLYHHIQQALRANFMMKKDRDYIVSDGEVLIVDEFTGRVMIGRRYSEGLHQAIEAKEGVRINCENKTLATITFQNFFRMYEKISGMTGTAKTEEDEFRGIYNLDVVTIPSNKTPQRIDEQDQIYTTINGKLNAVVNDIIERNAKGQPVLVGTVSVDKSEELSKILLRKRIRHNVLNAKFHKQEAEIIAQAGRFGTVTIATNMAGRGTDIVLGGNPEFLAKQKMEKDGFTPEIIAQTTSLVESNDEDFVKAKKEYQRLYDEFKKVCDDEKEKVIEAGGLHIIGTERHESRRIDNQLRGRAGRQGDKGSTVFYISLDDDVARIFGGEKIKSLTSRFGFEDDDVIANPLITKQIERAQRAVEGRNYSIRKQVLSFDDVMNAQREIIYKERKKVLDGLDIHDQIIEMCGELVEEIITAHADYAVDYETWDYEKFNQALEQRVLPRDTNLMNSELCSCFDVYVLKEKVMETAIACYEKKIADCKEQGLDFSEVERYLLLKTVDSKWMDHIDAMDALRGGIGLRGYGQRDPVIAYREEGWQMFEEMVENIHKETAALAMKIMVQKNEDGKETMEVQQAANKAKEVAVTKIVGRNDPCPCGSGLKYKNCCGKKK